MRRLIPVWAALVLALLLPAIVAAQGSTRVDGQVMDIQGNPWPDVTVEIKNPDTGQTFTMKTDKAGHYSQLLPRGGIYDVRAGQRKGQSEFHREALGNGRPGQHDHLQLQGNRGAAEELERRRRQEGRRAGERLQEYEGHFDAGIAAMNDSNQVQQQLASAPADQKSRLQDKLKADAPDRRHRISAGRARRQRQRCEESRA